MKPFHTPFKHFQFDGDRFCEQCRQYRPRKGGTMAKSADGRRQKWICEACTAKTEERRAA